VNFDSVPGNDADKHRFSLILYMEIRNRYPKKPRSQHPWPHTNRAQFPRSGAEAPKGTVSLCTTSVFRRTRRCMWWRAQPQYGGDKEPMPRVQSQNQAAKAHTCGTQRLRPPAQNRQTR